MYQAEEREQRRVERSDDTDYAQGQAVFDAANQPKQFWRVPGAHHNDLLYVAGNEYVPHLRLFYDSAVR